jgi:hypothetical protein
MVDAFLGHPTIVEVERNPSARASMSEMPTPLRVSIGRTPSLLPSLRAPVVAIGARASWQDRLGDTPQTTGLLQMTRQEKMTANQRSHRRFMMRKAAKEAGKALPTELDYAREGCGIVPKAISTQRVLAAMARRTELVKQLPMCKVCHVNRDGLGLRSGEKCILSRCVGE